MNDVKALANALGQLVDQAQQLQQQAAQQYQPRVDELLQSGCRDAHRIEHTLDGLLDFCGHPPVLEMYRRLCRHYWAIDPAATAFYVHAYRTHWDSDGEDS